MHSVWRRGPSMTRLLRRGPATLLQDKDRSYEKNMPPHPFVAWRCCTPCGQGLQQPPQTCRDAAAFMGMTGNCPTGPSLHLLHPITLAHSIGVRVASAPVCHL